MMAMKESNFVSAVCYVHNNENDILVFLETVHRALDSRFKQFEIICVNDASTDGSRAMAEAFARDKGVAVSIVNMGSFHGVELAMDAGVDLAIGDFVYEFDSVIVNYGVELVLEVYDKALEGFDIVSASPRNTWGGVFSRMFYKVFNFYRSCEHELRQETFHIVSRRAINRINDMSRMLVYRKAAYANCGLRIASLEYDNARKARQYDAATRRSRRTLATEALILFTNAFQRGAELLSALFLLSTVLIGFYALLIYFGGKRPVEGWTPLMLYLSLGFFGIFLILSVVVRYLSLILKLIFRHKHYLVESVEKVSRQ